MVRCHSVILHRYYKSKFTQYEKTKSCELQEIVLNLQECKNKFENYSPFSFNLTKNGKLYYNGNYSYFHSVWSQKNVVDTSFKFRGITISNKKLKKFSLI